MYMRHVTNSEVDQKLFPHVADMEVDQLSVLFNSPVPIVPSGDI